MKRFSHWMLGGYALYLCKTAIGINILPNHSAPWFFKLPIAPLMDAKYGEYWHD
jgi:hypothetical protein